MISKKIIIQLAFLLALVVTNIKAWPAADNLDRDDMLEEQKFFSRHSSNVRMHRRGWREIWFGGGDPPSDYTVKCGKGWCEKGGKCKDGKCWFDVLDDYTKKCGDGWCEKDAKCKYDKLFKEWDCD